jgi:hypothetical protein
MRIFQSLADASLYRTMALIPEQVMFGLALAKDPVLKASPETTRNLEIGREFCEVLCRLSGPDRAHFIPKSPSAAAIAAGVWELDDESLKRWNSSLSSVCQTVNAILSNKSLPASDIDSAIGTLRDFSGFAKQRLSASIESEHLQRVS